MMQLMAVKFGRKLCRRSSRCSSDDGGEVSTCVRRMYIRRVHPGAGTDRLLWTCCQRCQRPALLLVIFITTHVICLLIALYLVLFLAITAMSYICVCSINCLLITNVNIMSNTLYSFIYSREFDSVFNVVMECSFDLWITVQIVSCSVSFVHGFLPDPLWEVVLIYVCNNSNNVHYWILVYF